MAMSMRLARDVQTRVWMSKSGWRIPLEPTPPARGMMLVMLAATVLGATSRTPLATPSTLQSAPARRTAGHACALNQSQSQRGEDLTLLPALLALTGGRTGTFVEIGALDGVFYSNTLMLERCYGWTGLLIEANPSNAARLRRNLAAGRRDATKAQAEYAAVCDHAGGVVNMTATGGAVAGAVETFTPEHLSQWGNGSARHAAGGLHFDESRTVAVPCRPMSHMLADAHLLPRATFLSLDVEGAEETVANTCKLPPPRPSPPRAHSVPSFRPFLRPHMGRRTSLFGTGLPPTLTHPWCAL
jgi:FkbM family methyltransferase